MAVVSFTIPDAQIGRVLDAYCAIHGWRSVAEDGSRASFARAAIMRDIAGTVRAFEQARCRGCRDGGCGCGHGRDDRLILPPYRRAWGAALGAVHLLIPGRGET